MSLRSRIGWAQFAQLCSAEGDPTRSRNPLRR